VKAPSVRPKAPAKCGFDLVSLGEVMLRLDPGDKRIRTARVFEVWEGGGEYNVARALACCFGLRSAVVTALADNEIGRLVEGLVRAGGVSTEHIVWLPERSAAGITRNGLNFTERGFGVRGALGVSDRSHTAAAQLTPADFDWDRLFNDIGVRWLHTGGIFAAISEAAAEVARTAVAGAATAGTITSFDLNFRPSLWPGPNGAARARAVNDSIASQVDVLLGNEEDFTAGLGLTVRGLPHDLSSLDVAAYQEMLAAAAERYPNVSVVAVTLRTVHSASRNDWAAVAWSRTEGFAQSTPRQDLEIYDRVGGGDSFASGLIYALMDGRPLVDAVEIGAAHGALAMTTPGDGSMATKDEILRLAAGGTARVRR
jgi:2-dehydro-3-deoxygluconokinase